MSRKTLWLLQCIGWLASCTGTEVSDPCALLSCPAASSCRLSSSKATCVCDPGYHLDLVGSKQCVPESSCGDGSLQCVSPATCADLRGVAACVCPAGYDLAVDGKSCTDRDECTSLTHPGNCVAPATCVNAVGSFSCACPADYSLSSDGMTCIKRSACDCMAPATCSNSGGSYRCLCPSGYELGADGKSCSDWDECTSLVHHHNCIAPAACVNTPGSFACQCPPDYSLSSDGRTCIKKSACDCVAPATCSNSGGSYSCLCPSRYDLAADGKSCSDWDECTSLVHPADCVAPAMCVNTAGSFRCDCPSGYTSSADHKSCTLMTNCPAVDIPDPSLAPGAAEVYFTTPDIDASQVGCRVAAAGTIVPTGRIIAAIWDQGVLAVSSQPPWRVGDNTGFSPGADAELPLYQRGPNTTVGTSAIQLRHRTFGMWFNSEQAGVTTSGDILPIVAHFDFPEAQNIRPFSSTSSELAYRFELQIPTAQRIGSGELGAGANFMFRDARPGSPGRRVWYTMVAFDLRPAPPESVFVDSCANCSGFPIIDTVFGPNLRYGHMAPGSASFTSTPWTGFRAYDFRVSASELSVALADTQHTFGLSEAELSSNPADYRLVHFNFNPELYAPAGSGGRLGVSVRNIVVARYLRAAPPVYDHVYYRGANSSTSSQMQIFFQTDSEPFYSEEKSMLATLPNDGSQHNVVFNFDGNAKWKGTITRLRVDPFDAQGCFDTEHIFVGDAAGNSLASAKWDFKNLTANPAPNPILGWTWSFMERTWADASVAAGAWGACSRATDTNPDPQFASMTSIATGR